MNVDDLEAMPLLKFFRNGTPILEIKDHQEHLIGNLKQHNKDDPYLFDGPLKRIENMTDFNKANSLADGRVVAVIFNKKSTEANKDFQKMKQDYLNVDFYEVDVTSVGPDFKREFVPEVGNYPKYHKSKKR